MKILYNIAFIIIISITAYSQQTSWFWQNPLPQGNVLNSVSMPTLNDIYIAGQSATILISHDAGVSWIVKNYINGIDSVGFYKIKFINNTTGYVCGDFGYIMKTTSAGETWVKLTSNTILHLNNISILNDSVIFIGGTNVVLKTTNSGQSWNNVYTNINGCTLAYINSIQFINETTGFLAGTCTSSPGYPSNSVVLKTTNSGNNWNAILGYYNSIYPYFLNDQTGYASVKIGLGPYVKFARTTNSGTNWQLDSMFYHGDIYFKDVNTGWLNANGIYKTTNAGYSWNTIWNGFFGPSCGNLPAMDVYNENNIIDTKCINIIKTSNSGTNWYNLSKADALSGGRVQFTDAFTGWTTDGTAISRSTDGGTTWIVQNISGAGGVNGLWFLNNNTGFISCDINGYPNHRILKTTNSGVNWTEILNIVGKIFFCNSSIGFIQQQVSVYKSVLWKTTDAGNNWAAIYNDTSFYGFKDTRFINSSTGYAISALTTAYYTRFISKTTDGGYTWFNQSPNPQGYYFTNAYFPDENTGYTNCLPIGNIGRPKLFKTTNGGVSWIEQNARSLWQVTTMYFRDANTGYISATPYLMYTSNGGLNWNASIPGTMSNINDICFINEYTGWLSGNGNVIMKTTNGGGIMVNTQSTSNEVPTDFMLHQNYPNPFNPSTKIKFDIPETPLSPPFGKGGIVSLKIFDILGREVAILINDKLTPGTHEVDWNADSFASGVYFYSLFADGVVINTKKLVLMK
ncbi:MAG: T9SS C-terminal target domain-containing protein [Ignavibacteriae bacterium]|nr:MAG: T9SS C-terminal target domain-containing protein [Ignavibacteriota bacterium]